jgi:hypothetical protein
MDPYFFLSDFTDTLWDLYQNTDGKTADQARSMYDTLENVYLEPIRKSKIRDNTEQYATLTANLKADIDTINKNIQKINKIADDVQKVAQFAAIFDQITAIAAKLLV